ncbi:MAG: SufD family Fe-S cluster assembly protein [Lachnospiraceae bacterium]|nr:SufD family Fe-S cluster assembly protein [Lachnospiraceae bacterium]
MAENIMINSLVPPTWNRLKVNEAFVELPEKINMISQDEGVVPADDAGADAWNIETGCGDELSAYLNAQGIKPLTAAANSEELFVVKPAFTADSAQVLCFDATEGKTLNILTDLSSGDDVQGTGVFRILIRARENSVVNLTQILRPGKGLRLINDIGTQVSDKAKVNLVQVFTGGSDIYAGYRSELSGEDAFADCRIGLVRGENETLDMNYVMKHLAPRSKSEINVSGALSNGAKKTFRGTIDFVRGCAGAEGAENESILILDDTVINKTVPLILCTEENVAGSHGASIGKPAEEMLYYMMSRGIDRKRALEILERASLTAAAAHIENADALEYVMNIIDENREDD